MAPCRRAKMSGVVVGISRPRESIIRHVIPFFARDFASFAADANGRVGEEADLHFLLYEIVAALVGAFCGFPDHIVWWGRTAGPSATCVPRSRRARRSRPTFCSRPLILFLL